MNFSGQTSLIENLEKSNSRTMLIYGPNHHGKKTLLRRFYAEKGLPVYEITGNVADFRESIDLMRTQMNPTVYIIPDVDTLNLTIQNLLLKVLEEPPMKAVFVLTASNRILPTIKSRCVTFMTAPYTKEEILAVSAEYEPCLEYADSPGGCELIRQVVDFSRVEPETALRSMMTYIEAIVVGETSLAKIILKVNAITSLLKDKGIPYYTFWLLAKNIYKNCNSLKILSVRLNAVNQYVLMDFYLNYWRERNCTLL